MKLCNAFTIGYPRHARRARWVRYDNPDPLYLCGECARKLSGWTRQIWSNRLGEPAPEGLRIHRLSSRSGLASPTVGSASEGR